MKENNNQGLLTAKNEQNPSIIETDIGVRELPVLINEIGLIEDDLQFKSVDQLSELTDKESFWIYYESRKEKCDVGKLAIYIARNYPIFTLGKTIYLYENGVYVKKSPSQINRLIMKYLPVGLHRKSIYSEVATNIENITSELVSRDKINANKRFINVSNGLLDVVENKLYAHSGKIVSTVQIKARFNKLAVGTNFEKYLEEVAPNKEQRELLQEILGYCLSFYTNAKKFFIFYGDRDSGKSTFVNLLGMLLGMDNISNMRIDQFQGRFDLSHLFGKTVNTFSEMDKNDLLIRDSFLFKALTSIDEPVTMSFKYENNFNAINTAKLMFATNHKPKIVCDDSKSIYTRLIPVPFNRTIPKDQIDSSLNIKLQEERDYILTWAMEGLARLVRNDFKFTMPSCSLEALENYVTLKDIANDFIDEFCRLGAGNFAYKSELFEKYVEYCADNNFNAALEKDFYQFVLEYNEAISMVTKKGDARTGSFINIGLK